MEWKREKAFKVAGSRERKNLGRDNQDEREAGLQLLSTNNNMWRIKKSMEGTCKTHGNVTFIF